MTNGAKIERAMVFAAGLGKRMRPITDNLPKPLIKIAGKTMLDYALERLEAAGVKLAVVNSHYFADQIERHIIERKETKMKIVISYEEELLETGGGIVKALKYFDNEPFFSVNSDIIWLDDKNESALDRLNNAWDPSHMDILMLIHEKNKALGYDEAGDFEINDNGQIYYPNAKEFKYVYTGVQIIKPELFKDKKPEPFSLTQIYRSRYTSDSTLKGIYGIVHNGDWLHIGTPEAIPEAEEFIAAHY